MTNRPKILRFTPDHENPRLLLHKSWPGYVVMATEARLNPMRVSIPSIVTVPFCARMGPVTREREIEVLRRTYKGPSDIYVLSCTTPAGVERHGIIAVPKALVPTIEVV